MNLEHILPVTPSEEWKHIDAGTAAAFHKRLGNMVVLGSKTNTALGRRGRAGLPSKRAEYERSPLSVTSEVARDYTEWGPDQIRDRQKKLAELAPRIWPLTWK